MSSGVRIVDRHLLLGDQQDVAVLRAGLFQRADGLIPAHEEREDRVREIDRLADRQQRQDLGDRRVSSGINVFVVLELRTRAGLQLQAFRRVGRSGVSGWFRESLTRLAPDSPMTATRLRTRLRS